MTAAASPARPPGRGRVNRLPFAAALVGLALAFAGLGAWQVARLRWKLDLIAQTQARVKAPPVPAPGPSSWPSLDRGRDAYKRVSARGVFLNDRETLVRAVTDAGAGFWVLTPLRTDRGFTVLVNRGFVPPERRSSAARAAGRLEGERTIEGLLRLSEPLGGFLRRNDPARDAWFSRDVAAIAATRGLSDAAPYFIDAGPEPNPGGWPLGGLTVVRFTNNHLAYALTWFGLAGLCTLGVGIVLRQNRGRGGSGPR